MMTEATEQRGLSKNIEGDLGLDFSTVTPGLNGLPWGLWLNDTCHPLAVEATAVEFSATLNPIPTGDTG